MTASRTDQAAWAAARWIASAVLPGFPRALRWARALPPVQRGTTSGIPGPVRTAAIGRG